MASLQAWLSSYWNTVAGVVSTISFKDFVDVAVVAYIVYHAMRLVRETRAAQFVKSIAVIFVIYFFANQFNMITLRFLVQMVLDVGLVVLIVLFQPELRRALEQLGRSKLSDIGKFGTGASMDELEEARLKGVIDMVCQSCEHMSAKKTGALIVIERKIRLGEIVNTGTVIDAEPSTELIENIFFTNSPLHDGAMLIRQNRLYAAGCFLPLSDNMEIGRELGTRHRAALGMSEVSDAVVVVVSEETGAISVALDSRLQRGLSVPNLNRLLTVKLVSTDPEKEEKPNKVLSLPSQLQFWRKKK